MYIGHKSLGVMGGGQRWLIACKRMVTVQRRGPKFSGYVMGLSTAHCLLCFTFQAVWAPQIGYHLFYCCRDPDRKLGNTGTWIGTHHVPAPQYLHISGPSQHLELGVRGMMMARWISLVVLVVGITVAVELDTTRKLYNGFQVGRY